MPTMIQTVSGTVTAIWGKAMIRGADGKMRALQIGDLVVKGDVILTSQNGIVQLNPEAVVATAPDEIEIEPAAGAGAGSLLEGLRVGRISEATTDANLGQTTFFDTQRIGPSPFIVDPGLPVANPDSLVVDEDKALDVALTGRDPNGFLVSFTVVQVPTGGVLYKADRTPIAANTVLTPTEAENLVFEPAPNFNGNPGNIEFFVTDDSGNQSPQAPVTISVTPVNDPPVAGTVPNGPDDVPIPDPSPNHIPNSPNYRATTPEETPVSGRINATDIDLDTLVYRGASNPANGTVTVNPDGSWTYTPNPDYNGPDRFDVIVDDNNGGTDRSTVFIDVTPVADIDSLDTARTIPQGAAYKLEANDFAFIVDQTGEQLGAVRIDALPARGSLLLDGRPVVAGELVAIGAIADGRLVFAPAAGESGLNYSSFEFSVQAASGIFDPAPNRFSFDVTPIAVTPAALDDITRTPEDTPVVIDVLANDFRAKPGDTLTITEINGSPITVGSTPVVINDGGGAPIGSVALSADSKLVFTPTLNYNGPANFVYTINDGAVSLKANVRVDVTPVNDPPVANPDTLSTPANVAVTVPVRQNDSDVDNDPLTVVAVTQGSRGTVAIDPVSGNPVYTPNPGSSGRDTFEYTISDGQGGRSTSTVTVNVGASNQPPLAAPDQGSIGEDGLLSVGALQGVINGPGRDTDPDGDTLTVRSVAFGPTAGAIGTPLDGAWGTLVLRADGSYSYKPSDAAQTLDDGESRTDVFSYTVTDLGGLTSTTTLSITVTGANDRPVAVVDRATTPENTPVEIRVLDNDFDIDGDALTVVAINGAPITVGVPVPLFWVPEGTDARSGAAVPGRATILAEELPAGGSLIGTLVLTPQGTLIFTPAQGFNGPLDFDYTISDGTDTDSTTVYVVVDTNNDPPVAADDVVAGIEDVVLTFDPRANDIDIDGDPLTITAVDGKPVSVFDPVTNPDPVVIPEGKVFLNPDGTLRFVPNPGVNGVVTFPYTIGDGRGGDDSATIRITLDPVNQPPEGHDAVRTTPEDTPYIVQANDLGFTDPDVGDRLTAVRIDSLPGRGSLTLNQVPVKAGDVISVADIDAGKLSFIAAPNDNGVDYANFTFSVRDSAGIFDLAPNTFSFNVDPVNDTPVAGDDKAVTPEDTPITIDVLANDSDADIGTTLLITKVNGSPIALGSAPIAVNGVNGTQIGAVTITADNKLTFTPAKDYNGPAEFNYTISDGLTSVQADVRVDVTPVNDPPVANPDSIGTLEDVPVSVAVRRNDTDIEGDPLTVIAVTQGTRGSVAIDPVTGNPVYTPNPGTNGIDRFDYTISDGKGGSSSSTVTVNVGAVNKAPIANPDAATTNEDTALFRGVAQGVILGAPGTDSDPDGDSLTVTSVALGATSVAPGTSLTGAFGVLTLQQDGSYTYAPSAAAQALQVGQARDDVFSYTVSDLGGLASTTTLTITVTGVNDGPVAVNDRASTREDTPVTINVLGNDRDPENDPLTVTQVDGRNIVVGTPLTLSDPIKNLPIGTVALNADGTLTFTPADGFNGTPTFSYTISDGRLTSSAIVSLIVDAENDPPVANRDVIGGPENTVLTFDPRANDTDPDTPKDQLLIAQINGQPIVVGTPVQLTEGSLLKNADGTLSFAPKANFTGQVVFDYTLSDGELTDVSQVIINVGGALVVNDVTVEEGSTAAFTVRVPDSAQPTLIKLTTSTADPAFSAEDADLALPLVVTYVNAAGATVTLNPASDGSYTVPAHVTSLSVGVPTFQDQVYEGPETFGLTATSTSASVTRGDSGVGTIVDDRGITSDLPIIGIKVDPPVVDEDGSINLTYTVAIANGKTSEFDTTVNFTLAGSATEGTDYATVTKTVTIPAGQTSTTFVVDPTVDDVYEGKETVVATLTTASTNGVALSFASGALGSAVATGTIDDDFTTVTSDKPIIGITVNPSVVDEDGAINLSYTVAMVNGKTSAYDTVVSFTLGGTATEGTDYATVTKTVTIPKGQTSATFVVDPTVDDIYEGKETVVATLTSAVTNGAALSFASGALGSAVATGTIDDDFTTVTSDKPIIGITVNPSVVDEDGAINLSYTVAMVNGKTSAYDTVVSFTLGGTATEGTDYATVTKTVTIPKGQTSATFVVDPTVDDIYEGKETVVATLTSAVTNGVALNFASGALGSAVATGTIDDDFTTVTSDKPIIGITVNPSVVDEDGAINLSYTVAMVNGKTSAYDTVVSFTLGGTATEGTDYATVTKTVTIPKGQTSATFVVDPTVDDIYEGKETVVATLTAASTNGVALSLASGALGSAVATGTIDDDFTTVTSDKPIVGISVTPDSVREDGATNLIYKVEFTNGKTSAFDTTVSFTLGGSATEGSDYATVTKTVTIRAGQTSASFEVNPIADKINEADETVIATLVAASTGGVSLAFAAGASSATGTIVDDDTPPTLRIASGATVSEEALPGGIAEPNTTPSARFLGTLTITDPEGGPFTLKAALPTETYKSGGVNVVWTTADNGVTLEGRVGPGADGLVATLKLLPATSQYEFTLLKPLEHVDANGTPTSSLGYSFNITATDPDGHVSAPATLSVAIADDTPATAQAIANTVAVSGVNTNVMIILDVSSSMNFASGVDGGGTRLDAAKRSVNLLLDRYDELGDVRVRLETFATHAQGLGTGWLTVGEARALLAAIPNPPANGQGTNYDEALGDAITLFNTPGKLVGAQNVSYFLSDGQPTFGTGTIDELVPAGTLPPASPGTNGTGGPNQTGDGAVDLGIQAQEEKTWTDHLKAGQINSFALGFGGLSQAETALDPIAYDGRSQSDTEAVIVESFEDLDKALATSVRPPPVSGDLLKNNSDGADGAAFIKSLTVDGVTYTYNPANGGGVVVTGGASRGVFSTDDNNLTITTARNSTFLVDMDDGEYTYSAAASDSLPRGGFTEAIGYAISDRDGDTTASTLTVKVENPFIRGTAADDTLDGTANRDIIVGEAGNDALNGLAGNDALYGRAGDDTLNGGEGADRLVGGSGNDRMTGGAGSDVFAWGFADQGTAGAGRAVDTITDFSAAPAASGGDVLDLRDLLQGESQAAGNLQNYLDFAYDAVTGATDIRISTSGGFSNGNYQASQENQRITLENFNIRDGLGLAGSATDNQIIAELINRQKLITD